MNGTTVHGTHLHNLGVYFARAGHRTLAVTSISKGICLPPSVGIDFNELSLAAHPLLMDDEAEIHQAVSDDGMSNKEEEYEAEVGTKPRVG